MNKMLLKFSGIVLFAFLTFTSTAQIIPEKNLNVMGIKTKNFPDYPKKVYIKNFKVYYQLIAEAEKTKYGGRQIGGGSYTGNATARMAVGVEGIDTKDLQELTNSIYNRYIENVKALGLEIVTNEDIGNIEYFEEWELLQGPRINQEQIPGALMVIPADFSYYVKKVTKKGKEKGGGFMAGSTGDFSSRVYGPVPKLSDELDDIMIAEVAINIPSIWLDANAKLGSAKVKGGPYLRMQAARATFVSGESNKPGAPYADSGLEITVTKEIPINGVFKAEKFKTVATQSRTTTPDYAMFFTVDNTSVDITNTIECEADVYKEQVGNTINAFLDLSLEKLKLGLQGEKVK